MRFSKVISLTVSLMLSATAILAQQNDYWHRPGEKQVDVSGGVIFEEVRDPKTFTSRVFQNHVWSTYHYAPNTERIMKIEAPDTTVDFAYSDDGALVSKTVRFGTTALTVHPERTRTFGAGSMPTLRFIQDSGSREMTVVTSSGAPVASYTIDTAQKTASLALGNGLTLTITATAKKGYYRERLTDATGRMIDERVAGTERKHKMRHLDLDLDAVLNELGLDADWENHVHATRDSTSFLLKITSDKGLKLLTVVQDGSNQFGFDSDNHALFYDVMMDVYRGHVDDPDVLVDMTGLLPDHVILTADGRVGAYVSSAADGAITSFWNERLPSGAMRYAFRDDASEGRAKASNSSEPQGSAAKASGGNVVRRRLRADILSCTTILNQTTTQVCYDDGSCGAALTTTELGCTDVGGGGGGIGGGTLGGGGGGAAGGGSNNLVSGNPAVFQRVNQGITNAVDSLSGPPRE